jgi:hypothetical protein
MRSRASIAAVTSAPPQTPPAEAVSKSSRKAQAGKPEPTSDPKVEETP